MRKYYDEEEIRYYIDKYRLQNIIPNINEYGQERLHILKAAKGERPYKRCGDELVFLVEGSVKNCAYTKNGKRTLLHVSEGFEILRDLEVLRIENLDVEVEVLKNAVFLQVDLAGIRDELFNDPNFLRPMVMQLAKKVAKTTVAQTMIAAYSLESRLSSYILHAAVERFDGEMVFSENLVETADLLGTSYRHLLRTLKDFCEKGVLEHKKSEYFIKEMGWLEEKASDRPIYGRYGEDMGPTVM